MSTINDGRAFDWAKTEIAGMSWQSKRQQLQLELSRTRGSGRAADGIAFDAAGSSGLAFLQSALELIDPKLVEPLQAVTHPRDMPIQFGGGYPTNTVAWASNYGSSGPGPLGLQGTNNTDVPMAQADVEKGSWPTFIWSQGFNVAHADIQRMKFQELNGNTPPTSLQTLYEKSIRTNWNKDLDYVSYVGFQGNPGLVNNPDVPQVVVPGGTWAGKSPQAILADFNFAINAIVENSGYAAEEACPDAVLLPYPQFAALSQPMAIGGVGYDSTLTYIKRNCVAASIFGKDRLQINSLPNPWVAGQGIGNTVSGPNGNGLDRGVFYRKDEDNIVLRVPTVMTPIMTIPTTKGPGYATFFQGVVGSVMFLRTQTVIYLDGV